MSSSSSRKTAKQAQASSPAKSPVPVKSAAALFKNYSLKNFMRVRRIGEDQTDQSAPLLFSYAAIVTESGVAKKFWQFEADAIQSARAFFEGWGIPIVVDVLNAADAE